MSRNMVAVVSSALFVLLAAGLILIPVPFITWQPGKTVDVMGSTEEGPLIEISGIPTSNSGGKLLMTTVSTTQVDSIISLPAALMAHVAADSDVLPRDVVYPAGKSNSEMQNEAVAMMDSSRVNATVAALRAAGQSVTEMPMVSSVSLSGPANGQLRPGDLIEAVDPRDEYVAEAIKLASGNEAARADLRIVLTAMHGVGAAITSRVLAEAGFTNVSLVAAQADPDPDFPTVPFPNPEEAGALDMAIEQAREQGADLIIAVDPDADRCALAVPDPAAEAGWRPLSGDQIGCLLGEFLASRGIQGSLANSIVSSRLLARIAHAHGLVHHTTLTGFKWIARAPELAFGYEEAIGFCPNPAIARDKDGIASSVVAASLFAALKTEKRTAWDELDRLAHAHGLHVTGPLTFRVEEIEQIATGMARLRAQPPSELAGSLVVEVSDLSEGYQGLPPTDGVLVLTKAGDRVIARPSGTEPKLKCYLEVILPAPEGEPVPWDEAYERLELIKREFGQIIGL